VPYAAAGLAVGVVFFVMMAKPEKVAEAERRINNSDRLDKAAIGKTDQSGKVKWEEKR